MKKYIMAAALALVLGTAGLTSAQAYNPPIGDHPPPFDPLPVLNSQEVLALLKGCKDPRVPLIAPFMSPADLEAAGFHTPQQFDAWWQQFIKCFCRSRGGRG